MYPYLYPSLCPYTSLCGKQERGGRTPPTQADPAQLPCPSDPYYYHYYCHHYRFYYYYYYYYYYYH